MIALVDYGIGNLRSVEKALRTVTNEVQLTSDPTVVLRADKIVLPGVGAFGDGMLGLRERGLVEPLREVVANGKPLLAICVGMQLLFEWSEERGRHEGLGLLSGRVRLFDSSELKVPQTGWNQIQRTRPNPLLDDLKSDAYAYFNHSYYCEAAQDDTLAYTDYGIRYASVVASGHLYGVQFHPEKSQQVGLAILRNFVEHCQ
jgi:glutamine amidotransferase